MRNIPLDVIHPDDEMYAENHLDAYLAVGGSAIHVIETVLSAVGRDDPQTILDLPCGHGRVLRHLRATWPGARIVACDLNRSGVDFCAVRFDAEPVYSDKDPAKIPISDKFDLIWVGSLLTHLDTPLWRGFLSFFLDRLTPDGLLIFTASGRYVASRKEAVSSAAESFAQTGFGYYELPTSPPGYGCSYASPAWVTNLLSEYRGRVVGYWERGWNDHQDVIAISAERYDADWHWPIQAE
jgi:SAM-dependent methyltransferase